MADGVPRAVRALIGVMLMAAFVLVVGSLLTRSAGSWGVPYFSFNTERGSTCKNGLAGYTCSPTTLADLEFYGEVTLPDNTEVLQARYHATHDYQLEAHLLVPRDTGPAALAALTESFGPCQRGHPAPMTTAGLTAVCVMANDDATITRDSEISSRLYAVGTGLRRDGSRVVVMTIKSR